MINRNVNLKIFKMEVFIHLKKKKFLLHILHIYNPRQAALLSIS